MEKPRHHILVCASFRVGGEAKGVCQRKGSTDMLAYLDNEIIERGLDARVSTVGCLKECVQGPILIVYPEGHWYGKVEGEQAIDEVLDAVETGGIAETLLL